MRTKKIILLPIYNKFLLKKILKKKNIIYTFPWAKLYFKNIHEINNIKILNHPFKKDKILINYNYLKKNYELSLKFLAKYLNFYHDVKYSKKYWELIIGHWLVPTLSTLYEKYRFIKHINNSSNLTFYKNKNNNFNFSTTNLNDSIEIIRTHKWNDAIFYYFIKKLKDKIKIKTINGYNNNIFLKKKRKFFFNLKFVKKIVISIIFYFFNKFKKNEDIYLFETYLGTKNELKLQKKLNNYYKINPPINYKYSNKFDKKKRNEFLYKLNNSNNNKSFFDLAKPLLIQNMPISFLEDYKNIIKYIKFKLPQKTKLIFSASYFNDVFCIWCAEQKRKNNSKLMYTQHGGGLKTNLYDLHNYLFNKIFDIIFLWGKSTKKTKKYKTLFNIKNKLKFSKINKINYKNKKILLVQAVPTIYVKSFNATMNFFHEYDDYVNFQKNFYIDLRNDKKKEVIIRTGYNPTSISNHDIGEYEKRIWKDIDKNIVLEDRQKSIESSIKDSMVVIITHLSSTVLLECATCNIPFLILANLKMQIPSLELKKELKKLEKKHIMFRDPKKLAKFINSMSSFDFMSWWNSKEIQKNIANFRENFSRYSSNPVQDLSKEIKRYIQN